MIKENTILVSALLCTVIFGSCVTTSTSVGTLLYTGNNAIPVNVEDKLTHKITYLGVRLQGIGEIIGYHRDGLAKVIQYSNTLSGATADTWSNWFKQVGDNLLKSNGYSVLEISSAFSSIQDFSDSDYALAGTIVYVTYNTYGPLAGSYTESKLLIKWEILNLRNKTIDYATTFESIGRTSGVSGDAVIIAFKDNFSQLLSDDKYLKIVVLNESQKEIPNQQEWRKQLPDESEIIKINNANHYAYSELEVSKSIESVVIVKTPFGHGSGFFISNDGIALTNYHVIKNALSIKVILHDGSERNARVIRHNENADIALLEVDINGSIPLRILTDSIVELGNDVLIIGNPLSHNYSFSVSKGIISGARYYKGYMLYQTDASVNPGNSGGPIIQLKSNSVVGVVSSKLIADDVEGIAFGIEIDSALRAIGAVIIKD